MSDHLGDLAALYALGALDDSEHRLAEEHLAQCGACVRLIAQTEAGVAAIAETQPLHEAPHSLDTRVAQLFAGSEKKPRRPTAWISAIAAVLVLAILPGGLLLRENQRMHAALTLDADAMARMASSPHRMVAFTGADAKVVYGSDGSWYCVIIKGASAPLQVLWPHDGQQTTLGTAETHGNVALLYLPKSHRMNQLTITNGQKIIAQANLVF